MSKPSKSPAKKAASKTKPEADAPEGAAKRTKAKKAATARKTSEPVAEDVDTLADEPVKARASRTGKAGTTSETKERAADPALLKRLEEMTDFQLRAYQQSTMRISGDVKHAKSVAAKATLELIEAEVARRKVSPGRAPSPVRAAVASPKQGKKRD